MKKRREKKQGQKYVANIPNVKRPALHRHKQFLRQFPEQPEQPQHFFQPQLPLQ
jgi:hypothetical protein